MPLTSAQRSEKYREDLKLAQSEAQSEKTRNREQTRLRGLRFRANKKKKTMSSPVEEPPPPMETPALQRALASGYLTLPSIMENSSGLTPQEQQLYAASLQRQQTTGMAAIETIKNIAVGVNEGEDRFQLILLGQSPAIGTSSVLPHTSAHNSPQISPKKLMATASTPKESTRKRGSGTPLARTPKSTVKRANFRPLLPSQLASIVGHGEALPLHPPYSKVCSSIS